MSPPLGSISPHLSHQDSPVPSLSSRTDLRIPNDSQPVGIGNTLLPFEGEGLFSLSDIYFPVYDRKGVKTRWRPAELAICSYLGTRVRHSVPICPDYHSAYLASLIPDEWDIDAHEYTSCYGRFVNDNFSPGTINCKLQYCISIRRLVKCRFGWLLYRASESYLGKNYMRRTEKITG